MDKNSVCLQLQADSTAQACINGEEDNTDPSTVTSRLGPMSAQVSADASPQGGSDISSISL